MNVKNIPIDENILNRLSIQMKKHGNYPKKLRKKDFGTEIDFCLDRFLSKRGL